jgi:hypothetical protein
MKRTIMLTFCVCLSISIASAQEPTPTVSKETLMIRCILSGGAWKDNECVKTTPTPTGQPTPTTATEPLACNPLVCMLQHKGKCINNVCIPNYSSNSTTTTTTEYQRH